MSSTFARIGQIETGTSLYEVDALRAVRANGAGHEKVREFIFSSAHSRAICNDPLVVGCDYTNRLQAAGGQALKLLSKNQVVNLNEKQVTVLHLLRRALNFGLRSALCEALNFNLHSSAFISAQRERTQTTDNGWKIVESSYKKLNLKRCNQIIFGDVVATGTSLSYALEVLEREVRDEKKEISDLLFFTIGGRRSTELLQRFVEDVGNEQNQRCGLRMKATVVYFDGIFDVASEETKMAIHIPGTDLLRTGELLAPEFVESQYENPSFPLERCTIYDAGSRAFDLTCYLEDVKEYWEETLSLAEKKGFTFESLLSERMPLLNAAKFKGVSLKEVCRAQLAKVGQLLD